MTLTHVSDMSWFKFASHPFCTFRIDATSQKFRNFLYADATKLMSLTFLNYTTS